MRAADENESEFDEFHGARSSKGGKQCYKANIQATA